MTTRQILAALKKAGTAQNRKVYARHGVQGDMYGVSYAEQGRLVKKIGPNLEIALELWASGNHDARVLAAKIADPATITSGQLDTWARDLDSYPLTDALSSLAALTPHALSRMTAWKKRKNEWISSAGWSILSGVALRDEPALDDAFCLEQIQLIEATIQAAPNRTRYAMNQALIALGVRNPKLTRAATAAARRIGPVQVDHGETGCKTPDAAPYIAKTLAHRAARKKGP